MASSSGRHLSYHKNLHTLLDKPDLLIKIREEMQSMDNSARLILLASVVSELDKSIKTDY